MWSVACCPNGCNRVARDLGVLALCSGCDSGDRKRSEEREAVDGTWPVSVTGDREMGAAVREALI